MMLFFFFHIMFLFKIQLNILLFWCMEDILAHLPIEFNMRPNSYPESYDMDSNLERVFLTIPLMLLLVHIDMQAMINVR